MSHLSRIHVHFLHSLL